MDVTLKRVPCDQVQMKLWDRFQDKAIELTSTSFHMTRVVNGSLDHDTRQEIDLKEQNSQNAGTGVFVHSELERDWDHADPSFDENKFQAQVEAHDLTMFFFFADWCPHSRTAQPEWKKFVQKVDSNTITDGDSQVLKIAAIQMNCVLFEELCWNKDISDYPTIRLYRRDGSFKAYDGSRDFRSFYSFLVEAAEKTHLKGDWASESVAEGCHLKGLLRIPRVPGHLQFSRSGKGHSTGWADLSHSVQNYIFLDPKDAFSIGETGLQTNPLDGKEFTSTDKKTTFSHFSTLVQTEIDMKGFDRQIYQMSVLSVQHEQKDYRHLSIKFAHDMFPMAVKYNQEPKHFTHFVVRLAAIVGGLFTIFTLIHGGFKKKTE